MRLFLVAASVLALAGCDNKPNAGFEQSVRDRSMSDNGDLYAALDNGLMPEPARYVRRPQSERRDYAAGQARSYRASYDNLLKRLDTDEKIDRQGKLFAACRPAFAQASAYQMAAAKAALPGDAERGRIVDALLACREAAHSDSGDTAELLSRFASTGVVLVGITLTGQGDEAAGVDLWRRGSELAAKDKPGFQLDAKAFLDG